MIEARIEQQPVGARDADGSFLVHLPGMLMAPAPAIVAATFGVRDLAAARKHVAGAGFTVVDGPGRFMVPAEEALGVVHLFRQE